MGALGLRVLGIQLGKGRSKPLGHDLTSQSLIMASEASEVNTCSHRRLLQ